MDNISAKQTSFIKPNIIVIIFAVLAFVSIFLPWIGYEGQAFSMWYFLQNVGEIANEFSKANYLYLIILIPVSSVVVIVAEIIKSEKIKVLSKIGRIIIFIVNLAALIGLFYLQDMLSSVIEDSVFSVMALGYWISLLSAVVLLITVFIKTKNSSFTANVQNQKIEN